MHASKAAAPRANPAATAAAYVSLALVAIGAGACRAQSTSADTTTTASHTAADSSATQGTHMDSLEVVNATGLHVDSSCLQEKFTLLKKLVDAGQLDPIRTEIFDQHPIVLELLKKPHIEGAHNGTTIIAGLADGSYIVTIDPKSRYALYVSRKEDHFTLSDCIGSKK